MARVGEKPWGEWLSLLALVAQFGGDAYATKKAHQTVEASPREAAAGLRMRHETTASPSVVQR
jgi:hypothetical protein